LGEELISANREMLSRGNVTDPYRYALFDANGMTSVDVTAKDIQTIADQDISASRGMPRFVFAVYASSDIAFGLARMWELLIERSGWVTRVFRHRSDAVAWLKDEVAIRFGSEISIE